MLATSFEFLTILLDCVRILSHSLGVSRILSNSSEFSYILCEFSQILSDSFRFLCILANPLRIFRVLSNSSRFSRIPKNFSRIFANYVEFLLILSGSIVFSDSSGFIEFSGIFLDSLEFFHFLSDYFVFPRFFRILQDFNPSIISYFSNPHGFIRILSNSCASSPNFSILSYSFNSLSFQEFSRMLANSFEIPTIL